MENVGLNFVLIVFIFSSIIDTAFTSVSCTFDSGLCGWNSATSGQFRWRQGSGQTADRLSGPLNDHTCANYNGQYIYISGSKTKPNDIAVIETDHVTITDGTVLTFWYTMNGYAIGNLSLNAITDDQQVTTLWHKFGPQGKYWMKGTVTLTPGVIKLQFQSTVRLPSGSDVAIDDITLTSESQDLNKTHCFKSTTAPPSTTTITTTTKRTTTATARVTTRRPSTQTNTPMEPGTCLIDATKGVLLPGTCDFETDTCGIQVSADKDKPSVTWKRTNYTDGTTKDRQHAIMSDHTVGNTSDTGGYYMHFADGGSGRFWERPSNTARMETPLINSSHICLSFWYSLPQRYSNLKIYVKHHDGALTKIFDLNIIKESEIKTGWHLLTMDLHQESPFTIIFESFNQYHLSRVGIDDMLLFGYDKQPSGSTPSSETSSTTTTTSEPPSWTLTDYTISTNPAADGSTSSTASTETIPSNTTETLTSSTTEDHTSPTTKAAETISTGVPIVASSTNIISTTPDKGSEKKTTNAATKKPGKQELGESETDALNSENKFHRTSVIIGACVGSFIGLAFVSVVLYMLVLQVRDRYVTNNEGIHETSDSEDIQYGTGKHENEKQNGFSHSGKDNPGYCMVQTVCDADKTLYSKSKSDTITHF